MDKRLKDIQKQIKAGKYLTKEKVNITAEEMIDRGVFMKERLLNQNRRTK